MPIGFVKILSTLRQRTKGLLNNRATGVVAPSQAGKAIAVSPAITLPQGDPEKCDGKEASFSNAQHASTRNMEVVLTALKGLRILLAEDHEMNALLLTEELEHYGASVSHVMEGASACLGAFACPRPQVVLMDCQMPGVDGFEATRRIRATENQQGLSAVPIVALTGLVREFGQQQAMAAGMNAYLSKPFSFAQLAQTIFAVARPDQDLPRFT